VTKTKIALAAALLMGTATVATAEGTHANRVGRSAAQATPVRMNQDRNMSMPTSNNLMMNVMDRASSPFACGG
jgi:hypothetical protein